MYESPITLINGELNSILENGVYKVVRKVGINVNKDELIKALKYDRGQYEKGYADAKAERKKCKWIDKGTYCVCSGCQHTEPPQYDGVQFIPNFTPFCSQCGAEMGEVI